ncbi:amidohydrolase family protein [Pelagovum pacificum]|nr:amidohydrolase family protein [Pelagovum pacificum]QQA41943.1 amidohydrolase family protein [Pelagovum pacificum]
MSDTGWDCHVHVIGDRRQFPLSPTRGYEPPHAPLDDLLGHLDRLSIARAVIVHPSVYGFDNSCLINALVGSNGRCRGIAVPDPESTQDDLSVMDRAGVRGLRCNLVNPGGLTLDQTRGWWDWMRGAGWHLQLQIDATKTDIASLLNEPGLPPVVIDHMGYPPRGTGPEGIAPLVDAVKQGRVHVKLSAPYRISAEPAPHRDALALAAALLDADPERCLFATDWPHTELAEPPMPDADWLSEIRTLAGDRWQAMQNAAEALYGR